MTIPKQIIAKGTPKPTARQIGSLFDFFECLFSKTNFELF